VQLAWTITERGPNGWAECEELTLAEDQLRYFIGRTKGLWYAAYIDQARPDELWVRPANDREHARELSERHAHRRMH
jgi:hypothetical protein